MLEYTLQDILIIYNPVISIAQKGLSVKSFVYFFWEGV